MKVLCICSGRDREEHRERAVDSVPCYFCVHSAGDQSSREDELLDGK